MEQCNIKNDILETMNMIINKQPDSLKSLADTFHDLIIKDSLSLERVYELIDENMHPKALNLYNALYFKAIRLVLGLTQAELAMILDWTVRQVSHIENGDRALKKQTQLALKYILEKLNKTEEFRKSGFIYE